VARAAGGACLLEGGRKGSLITRIRRSLEGTQLRQHICIGSLKAGAVRPNGGQGARIACTTTGWETCGKAVKKPDHIADGRGSRARIPALINHGLDAFHLARDTLQAIPAGGNDIPLREGWGSQGDQGSKDNGAFPKFHDMLRHG
jgi:hypothetical protein